MGSPNQPRALAVARAGDVPISHLGKKVATGGTAFVSLTVTLHGPVIRRMDFAFSSVLGRASGTRGEFIGAI